MVAVTLLCAILSAPNVSDGTIIVLENSNPAVEIYTRSEVTHVAMVVRDGEQVIVYEATPDKVRRLSLDDYYREIGDINRERDMVKHIRLTLYQPQRPYSQPEIDQLRVFLNSQIGRRYSVRGYFREKPGDGIHCAEMVSTALCRTGRYQFPPNYTISPASLVAQIKPTHHCLLINVPLPEPQGTWCERSWNWWSGCFTWCRWACWESWTFCR